VRIRCDDDRDASHDELRAYRRGLGATVEVILVDGSGLSRTADT